MIISEPLSIVHKGNIKSGTLYKANSDTVILMLSGSGILNEDGKVNDNFRVGYSDWAKALSLKGFNVVTHNRYSSSNALEECYKTSYAKTLALEKAWVRFLQTRFKKVILLGHSLGGTLALDIVAAVKVDGIVLAATAAESFPQLLKRQLNEHSQVVLRHDLKQGELVKQMNEDVLSYWLKEIPLSKIRNAQAKLAAKQQKLFIQTLFPQYGLEKISKLKNQKILILHGKLDTKVLWQDAITLQENTPPSNTVRIVIDDKREHHFWRQNSSLELAIQDAAEFIAISISKAFKP